MYPITIRQAQTIAKSRLGHPLRLGYSVVVGGVFNGILPNRRWDYQLSLVHDASGFWFSSWTRPFSNPDMSQFKTIEYERDNR